ncbi:unnamed protein product [Ectocarpus sp. 6 AP-2014]
MGQSISVHVRQYFNAVLAGSVSTVRRPLKVVVVGKESVGKTSLRQSIVAGKARPTCNHGEESTVHIDVEDHELDGRPIRIFDCAGQVAYTGLLQLFLTPQVIHLLVVDMPSVVGNIENGTSNPLEDLGALRWVRSLSFRVPGAAVILVGTMCDRVQDTDGETTEARLSRAAGMVEDNIRSWIHKWTTQRLHNHHAQSIAFENGVSLVNCGLSCDELDGGWPCDVSQPSLLHRITFKDGKARGVDADLPLSWGCALSLLDETARRVRGQPGFRGVERTELDGLWHDKVDELKRGGHEMEATEHALDGAISIMAYEGSLVVYGSFVIVDVQWLATVLKPLCSHKDMSMGEVNLGGITVRPGPRVERLVKDGILEPKLAEELWPDTWEHLLRALSSAGLTFPRPNDKEGGLVVLLRLDKDRPDDVGDILDDFRASHDGQIVASCTLLQGAPPGFVERLLSTCCRLGSCNHFWRYGVLIQSRSFSLILEYAEDDDTLVGTFSVDAFGDSRTAGPWLALSGCLSVLSKMLSEFPGMDVEATLECPYHSGGSRLIPIDLYQRRPWQCFIREVDGCRRCIHEGEQNARHLFSRGLVVVPVTDSGFDTAGFTRKFDDATTEYNEGASAPRVTVSTPPRPQESQQGLPASRTTVSIPVGPSAAPRPMEPQDRVPAQIEALFGDLEKAFTIIAGGCLAAFAGLASVYTPEVWAPFLVLGMCFSLAAAASVLRKWCWRGGRLDPRSATGFSDFVHQNPRNGFENV